MHIKKAATLFFIVSLFFTSLVYAVTIDKTGDEFLEPDDAALPPASESSMISTSEPVSSQWLDGWYNGAEGYAKAVEEYEKTNKPMVVYASVGWCPYCRKFEKNVLSSPMVQKFLQDKIKVNINPEASRQENALAFRYGIMGFPSFFLHLPRPSRKTAQLYTGVTPEEFIQLFEKALKLK